MEYGIDILYLFISNRVLKRILCRICQISTLCHFEASNKSDKNIRICL